MAKAADPQPLRLRLVLPDPYRSAIYRRNATLRRIAVAATTIFRLLGLSSAHKLMRKVYPIVGGLI